MSKEKIAVYVENKGRGKVSIADSNITVQDFPAYKEGIEAIGINATKTEMLESHLLAFQGMVDVHFSNQLNVLSEDEYKAKKNEEESGAEIESESDFEEDGEEGTEEESNEGGEVVETEESKVTASTEEQQESEQPSEKIMSEDEAAFLVAEKRGSKKALKKFIKDYPESQFVKEAQALIEAK